VAAMPQGPMTGGPEQTQSVNEQKCRGWGGGVVGNRRVGRVDETSRETPRGQTGVHGRPGPKNRPRGVRASVVARKRGNARGAKGRRKVDVE